jgi:hypothetical protein
MFFPPAQFVRWILLGDAPAATLPGDQLIEAHCNMGGQG